MLHQFVNERGFDEIEVRNEGLFNYLNNVAFDLAKPQASHPSNHHYEKELAKQHNIEVDEKAEDNACNYRCKHSFEELLLTQTNVDTFICFLTI